MKGKKKPKNGVGVGTKMPFMVLWDNGFIAKSHNIGTSWLAVHSATACLCPRRLECLQKMYLKGGPQCWSAHPALVLKPKGGEKKPGKLQTQSSMVPSPVMTWESPTTPRPAPETVFLSWLNKTDGKLLKRLKYVSLLQRLCGSRKKKKSLNWLACLPRPSSVKISYFFFICL